MKIKQNLYLFGFIMIPVGVLLGQFTNKWIGTGIIAFGGIFAIACLYLKEK